MFKKMGVRAIFFITLREPILIYKILGSEPITHGKQLLKLLDFYDTS